MSSSSTSVPRTTSVVAAATAAPTVRASTVCYTNAFGTHCGSTYGGYVGWGVSLSILLLIFLFMGLFCFRDYRYSRDEENANLIYVQNHRLVPATYTPTYNREANPAKTHGPGYNQRARPTSYAAPYASNSDSNDELQYPATAYPFTGYSVPPPASHKSSTRVHSTAKTKDTT